MKIKNERKIQKTFRLRLYPTKEQEEKLLWTLERCRFVYNIMLDKLNKLDKLDKYFLQNSLPKLKEEYPDLKNVYSTALQYEVHRLFCNLKALRGMKKKGIRVGKLRFKGRGNFKTLHFNHSGFKFVPTDKRLDRLHISKIGEIHIRRHIPIYGDIKQVIIKKYPSGKWFACIIVDQDKIFVKQQQIKNVVGIDVGIKYFLSDSDGRQIENPHFLNKTLKQLKKKQRQLSKSKKGSKNRSKQRVRVARLHERITNQRKDYLHKLSRYYVSNYDMIVTEKLSIKNMLGFHNIAQSILDVSWHEFIQMLSYKAERASKMFIRVNPRNTSKIYKYKDDIDRDYNASLNILERGLKKIVGKGQTEFTPVDIRPLQKLITIPVSQVVESGNLLKNGKF